MSRLHAILIPALILASGLVLGQKPADKPEEPKTVTVAQLLKDPGQWHNKAVKVTAKVDKFEAKTSKKGNPYTVFRLVDGETFVSVYMKGRPAEDSTPKNGGKAEVVGIFHKEKKVGQIAFKNEIDASPVKGRPFHVKAVR